MDFPMPDPAKTPAASRTHPAAKPLALAHRPAPRRKGADLRLAVMEGLTSGLSVPHIAKATNRTTRRVRQIIADMLERRELDPAAGFAQLQIARLNNAMAVAHSMMMNGDLAALDRVVKVAGELDRYHGFFPGRTAAPASLPAPTAPARALAAPKAGALSSPSAEKEEIILAAND